MTATIRVMQTAAMQTARTEPAVFDLKALLSPADADSFLRYNYGRVFVHVPGYPGKFSSLLPWPTLNKILEEHRLEPPRLRLMREGRAVPAERYLTWQTNRRSGGSPIPRLSAANLTRELREGATLVLDNVDEVHRPVRFMAESLERVFRVRVQVNSYSGWRISHGFDLHWDDHDVFILQVAGRKRWKVYGMTRPFPLESDAEPAAAPSTDVLWDGLLQDGDLLYIPRGWWHVATPLDEPTLHLTVGVNNPTGADFLSWFARKLRSVETVRLDLPHLAGPEALEEHASRLKVALLEAWRPELINEYMAHLDSGSRARPQLALPWTACEAVLPDGDFRVRWSGTRELAISEETNGIIAVVAFGERWRFAAAARGILEALLTGREFSNEEIVGLGGSAGLHCGVVRAFLRELAMSGLVTVQ
jgi:hypothetical protein